MALTSPPEYDLSLAVCQGTDCTTVTLTDTSAIFLKDFIHQVKIKKVEIIVSQDGSELATTDVTNQFYIPLTGTLSTNAGDNVVSGVGSLFSSELAAEDYVQIDVNGYYFRVDAVVDTLTFYTTTSGDQLSGVTANLINTVYSLDGAAFGGSSGEKISDGVYDITYKITIDYTLVEDNVYTQITNEEIEFSQTIALYCGVKCCVKKKLAALANIVDCCPQTQDVIEAMMAWAWLANLENQNACQNTAELENSLELLKAYCLGNPCNC